MNMTLFLGLLAFSLVSGFTPGPNNLLALASGANYGYKRTLPHILGVCLGFACMIFLMGAGLGSLFKAVPMAYVVLRWGSLAYLLFLAWKIASSTGFGDAGESSKKPITFLGSAAFQWINPKAWVAAITLVTTFTDPLAYWRSLTIGGFANVIIAFSAVSTWALFGTIVKTWLADARRLRVFNWSMAILLVVSVVPAVLRAH